MIENPKNAIDYLMNHLEEESAGEVTFNDSIITITKEEGVDSIGRELFGISLTFGEDREEICTLSQAPLVGIGTQDTLTINTEHPSFAKHMSSIQLEISDSAREAAYETMAEAVKILKDRIPNCNLRLELKKLTERLEKEQAQER